jgi:hypothetical protein
MAVAHCRDAIDVDQYHALRSGTPLEDVGKATVDLVTSAEYGPAASMTAGPTPAE